MGNSSFQESPFTNQNPPFSTKNTTIINNSLTPPNSQLSYLTKQRGSPGENTITPFDSVSQVMAQTPIRLKSINDPDHQTSNSLISQNSQIRRRKMESPISPTNTQITNFSRVR